MACRELCLVAPRYNSVEDMQGRQDMLDKTLYKHLELRAIVAACVKVVLIVPCEDM